MTTFCCYDSLEIGAEGDFGVVYTGVSGGGLTMAV